MNPREGSPSNTSTGMDRRSFLLGLTGLSVVAGCSQPASVEFSEADLAPLRDAIEECRTALQACLETPSQDTAETLNRASGLVNTMYFSVQPDLKASQRLDIGVQVGDLNEKAIEAVDAVSPKTRYTQHYLNSIKGRDAIWKLQAVGDHKEVRKLLDKQLAEAEKNPTHTMSFDDAATYMSQPADSK